MTDELELEQIDDLFYSKKLTAPYITKYEYVKMIAHRAEQLSRGEDTPKVNPSLYNYDAIKIAKQEMLERIIPTMLIRTLPDKTVERWSIKELNIRDY